MCVTDGILSQEVINQLQVCDVNHVILTELRKMRDALTPDQAMQIVSDSLEKRIQMIERDVHSPFAINAETPMMW